MSFAGSTKRASGLIRCATCSIVRSNRFGRPLGQRDRLVLVPPSSDGLPGELALGEREREAHSPAGYGVFP